MTEPARTGHSFGHTSGHRSEPRGHNPRGLTRIAFLGAGRANLEGKPCRGVNSPAGEVSKKEEVVSDLAAQSNDLAPTISGSGGGGQPGWR